MSRNADCGLRIAENLAGLSITNLVTDSRSVKRGDTFVAYPGEKSDGRQFIAQAIAQGAGAVIYEKRLMKPLATRLMEPLSVGLRREETASKPPLISEQTTPAKSLVMSGHPWDTQNFAWNPDWNVPNLAVSDLRHKAGWLADAVYGAPSEHLWMVGVTGTNGKTSTCHWIAQALNDAAKKCALIGTLGNGYADALQASANTTPDAIHVHGLLADYLRSGAQAVAMEVSSHALAQERVNGVKFDVALLTNLTRDHLDYHGDMESYAASKRRLFDWQALKFAVVNLDDAFGADLALQLREQDVEVIGYGLTDAALQLAERQGMRMVHGLLLEMSSHGLHLEIHSSWGAGELRSALVGRFNAANLLGALAVLLVSDVSFNGAVQSLSRVQPVAGRMQKIGSAGQPAVIVDYAHTPDALEKVLLALREACVGSLSHNSLPQAGESYADSLRESDVKGERLICVFGCGGDRDRGKRAMMGLVAEKYSDFCIVTSDNPRSEDADQIIREVVGGMALNNHEIIINRAAAIERAIGLAQCGDTVLVAGKGHEDYQEINGVKHPFSDVVVAMQALKNWSVPDGTAGGVQ